MGAEIELDTTTHHHIINVLRLKSGAHLVVFDGSGGEYEATLTRVTRTISGVTINKFIDCDRESTLSTRLLQGISRNDHMDYALQKAVELGVSEIQPIMSQRCTTRMNASRLENKYRHWKRVIVAACEQAGRTRIPKIYHPLTLKDSVAYRTDDFGIGFPTHEYSLLIFSLIHES